MRILQDIIEQVFVIKIFHQKTCWLVILPVTWLSDFEQAEIGPTKGAQGREFEDNKFLRLLNGNYSGASQSPEPSVE
jgi:hypothetical protein